MTSDEGLLGKGYRDTVAGAHVLYCPRRSPGLGSPPCPGCIRGILRILLVKKGQGSTASNKSMPEALPPLPQHFRSTRMWASMQEATTCIYFAESPRLGTGQRRSWVHGHSLCGMYKDEDHKVLSSRGLAVAGDTATSHKNS